MIVMAMRIRLNLVRPHAMARWVIHAVVVLSLRVSVIVRVMLKTALENVVAALFTMRAVRVEVMVQRRIMIVMAPAPRKKTVQVFVVALTLKTTVVLVTGILQITVCRTVLVSGGA